MNSKVVETVQYGSGRHTDAHHRRTVIEHIQCSVYALTFLFSLLIFLGLPDHVHPSPRYSQPDQLFLRQQHGASGEPRTVRPRRL